VTEKLPASPSKPTTSDKVWSVIFKCRPHSTNLGEIIHMAQSLVG
jgi:hypothetical protein